MPQKFEFGIHKLAVDSDKEQWSILKAAAA